MDRAKRIGSLSYSEQKVLNSLKELKDNFYNKEFDMMEWLKAIQEIENEKIEINLS